MPVFASEQEALLDGALPSLPAEGVVLYVSDLGHGNTLAGRQALLQAFADRGFLLVRSLGQVFGEGEGEAFELRKARLQGPDTAESSKCVSGAHYLARSTRPAAKPEGALDPRLRRSLDRGNVLRLGASPGRRWSRGLAAPSGQT